MKPTTLSTISTIPTLPTELVDEILKVETLSKPDLARCCLVSKLFLPTSRKALYTDLQLSFREADTTSALQLVAPDRSTLDLHHTLHRTASLRHLTTTLSFKRALPGISGTGLRFWPAQSLREWIDKLLAVTPNLKHFILDHSLSTEIDDVPRSLLENKSIISLGLGHLTYHQLAIISTLPNLKMLRFSSLTLSNKTASPLHPSRPVLPELKALSYCSPVNNLPASLSHALKVLRIDFDLNLVDFSLTPELARLYLRVQTYIYRVKHSPDLSPLLRLRYLHLDGTQKHNQGAHGDLNLDDLTGRLPPQPLVLAVTSFLSSSVLARRLNLQIPLPIRELHLSPSQDSHGDHSGLEVLYTTCARKGVKLCFDLEEKEIDVFCL